MKVTNEGKLNPINDCTITIPNAIVTTIPQPSRNYVEVSNEKNLGPMTIVLNNLPDITDQKSAVYNQESIIGRSSPITTYSHSAERTISLGLHFYIIEKGDAEKNINYLRAIQSAVYPQDGIFTGGNTTFAPPPVCKIKCNQLLGNQELCVVLQSYSVKFPSEVAWDPDTYCPYKFDVDTNWVVVYTSSDLPFQDRIVTTGR